MYTTPGEGISLLIASRTRNFVRRASSSARRLGWFGSRCCTMRTAAGKSRGMSPVYVEVPGATHSSVVPIAMPEIFDFLAEHSRSGH